MGSVIRLESVIRSVRWALAPAICVGCVLQTLGAARDDEYPQDHYPNDDITLVQPGYINQAWDVQPNGRPDGYTQWGLPGDYFLGGEPYGGWTDGFEELVVYRQGAWYVKRNQGNRFGNEFFVGSFGLAGDRPIVGRFADTNDDHAAVKQGNLLAVDVNRNLQFDPGTDIYLDFNVSLADNDILIALRRPTNADYLAVWRGNSGAWDIYANFGIGGGIIHSETVTFGVPGDIPFSGDLDGDGVGDLMVFRPSDNRVYINLYESGRWGYGPNGDLDAVYNYSAVIRTVNRRFGQPENTPWTQGALAFDVNRQ